MKVTTDTYIDIFNYCDQFRTSREICDELLIGKNDIWRCLSQLKAANILIETSVKATPENHHCRYAYIKHPSATKFDIIEMVRLALLKRKNAPKKAKKIQVNPVNVTTVSVDDYHTRIERTMPRVYVGSTAEII